MGTSVVSRVPGYRSLLCPTAMHRLCPESSGEPLKDFMQERSKEAWRLRRMTQASVWRVDYRKEPRGTTTY